MTESLSPCPSCSRHVRASASACPFCDGALRAPVAAVVFGAVLAAALASPSPAFAQSPRQELGQAPASAYGAPPDFDPMQPMRRPPELVIPPRQVPAQEVVQRVQVQEFEVRGAFDPTLVRRALQARYPALRRCLAVGGVGAEETIRGVLALDARGRVARLEIEGTNPARAACLRATLRAMRWPAPGNRVEVTVTVQGGGGGGRCRGPSPAGCRQNGCGEGMVCVRNSACVPSSCGCDPSTGQWTCTSDCGGGVCMPARGRPIFPR